MRKLRLREVKWAVRVHLARNGAQFWQPGSRAHENKCLGKGDRVNPQGPLWYSRRELAEASLCPVWGPAAFAVTMEPATLSHPLRNNATKKTNSKPTTSWTWDCWYTGLCQYRRNWSHWHFTGCSWGTTGRGQLTGASGGINTKTSIKIRRLNWR